MWQPGQVAGGLAYYALIVSLVCLGGCHGNDSPTRMRAGAQGTTARARASLNTPDTPSRSRCEALGFVPCQRQVLHVVLPIAGTSIRLTYSSDRVPGRKVDAELESKSIGLGGWSLNVLRSLDTATSVLTTGEGQTRHVTPKSVQIGPGLLGVADRDGQRIDVFDARGREVAVYDARTATRSLSFVWDAQGLKQIVDRGGVALSVVRDAAGVPVSLESPRGARTELRTTGGWLSEIRGPHASTMLTTGAAGLLTQLVDANGAVRRFAYDDAGRLISSTDSAGAVTTLARSESAGDLAVTTSGPSGARTIDAVHVDSDGSTRFTHTAKTGVTTRVEESRGHSSVVLPDGRQVEINLEPDPHWGMDTPIVASMSITGPDTAAPSVTFREQRTGHRALEKSQSWSEVVTINGKAWREDYDPTRLALIEVDPAGRRAVTTFDALGRVSARSAEGRPTGTYQYDPYGRVSRFTLGAGSNARIWRYQYGKAGDLTITDPLRRSSETRLTVMGALESVKGPGAQEVTLFRDRLSQLTQFTGVGQGAYRIVRRSDGQVSAITAPAGSGLPEYLLYEYDAAGRMTGVSSPDMRAALQRDAAERVMSIDYGSGRWSLKFDEAGRVTQASGPGATLTEAYQGGYRVAEHIQGPFDAELKRTVDALGRMTAQSVGTTPSVQYEYDDSGLLTRAGNLQITRDPHSGLIRSERLGALTRSWTYDPFGAPIRQTVTGEKGSVIVDILWQRDELGRIVQQSVLSNMQPLNIERYTYDAAGRLASWTGGTQRTGYTYDEAGNLVTVLAPDGSKTTADYDRRNELIRREGAQFSYNGAGQLISRVTKDGATAYHYDLSGALISVARPGAARTDYIVDAAGRRLASLRDGKLQYGIVYGDTLHPSAELDAHGGVSTRYVYAGGQTPVYVTKEHRDYLEIPDGTGSPRLILDSSTGAVVDAIVRDAFGRVLSETARGFQLVGFAGGVTDPDTGLIRFGVRDYDPQTARWTAPDPLMVRGGSPNLYSYVAGDPVNRIDPSGGVLVAVGGNVVLTGPVGVTFGGGVVTNGDPYVLPYVTGGAGVGAEAGGSVSVTVAKGDQPTDLTGGPEFDIGLGPISFTYSPGSSFGVALGGKVGLSALDTGTYVIPAPIGSFPMEPDPQTQQEMERGACEGMDAGTCDPAPDDPQIGNPDDPNSPNLTCSGGGTCNDTSNMGDPHLRTLDSVFYDLMAVGEFTGLQSDSGDLIVQFRQAPLRQSRTISVISAVAINTLGDRILASADGTGEINVEVNGSPQNGRTSTALLPHGAYLVRTPTELHAALADGSDLVVKTNPGGLDFLATLPSSRKDHMRGLLGPAAGSGLASRTVRSRDGRSFSAEQLKDYATLYRKLGDSWRLAQKDSLFRYERGQTTATFTDKSFPDRVPEISSAQRSFAARLCESLPLPPWALESCVLDVATSGDAGYAASATSFSAVPRTARPVAESNSIRGVLNPGSTGSGFVSADTSNFHPINASAGTVAYFAAAQGCLSPPGLRWTIETGDGSGMLGIAAICNDIGRVVFAQTGPYRIRVYGVDASTGDYRIQWLASRPDKRLSLRPGAPANGRIDLPGAADVYDFDATAGTVAYFAAAQGCSGPPGFRWTIETGDGSGTLGMAAICNDLGRIVFAHTGPYRIRVYGVDASIGAYQISWK